MTVWLKAVLFCVVAITLAGTINTATAQTARLPRDNLLLFHDDAGQARPVTSLDDWSRRRAEILRGMESVMGKLPGAEKRVPLELKTEEEVDGGAYIRRLVNFTSEPTCRTPAYLLIPKAALTSGKKVPAVLALHGTNMDVGHGSLVGLGKTPYRDYAPALAKRGYVVIAPNYPIMAGYQPDITALGWESGTLKAVWDNMRCLDLLESLSYVDKQGFGAIGHSLGGHNSIYTAVFDQRIKVAVSSCGLDSYLDYYGGDPKRWEPGQGWCQTRYMLKLANYKGRLAEIPFDFHEMIAAIAPRNVLIIAPTRDSNFQAASVDRVAKSASAIYQLHGQPDHLRVIHPEGEHDFPPEMIDVAFRQLDDVLKPKGK